MHKQSLSVTINKGHHYVGQVCSWLPCRLLAKRGNVERIPHHVSFRASEMKLSSESIDIPLQSIKASTIMNWHLESKKLVAWSSKLYNSSSLGLFIITESLFSCQLSV